MIWNLIFLIILSGNLLSMESSNNQIEIIIFDFDGTICDTYQDVVEIFNKNSPSPLSGSELSLLRDMPSGEVVKKFGIPPEKLPDVMQNMIADFQDNIDRKILFFGLQSLIPDLAANFRLAIVTSNSVQNVSDFLTKKQMLKYFELIKSVAGLGVKEKADGITKVLDELKIAPKNSIYVGDELRDIEASQKAGVSSVAVTWGYNTLQAWEKMNQEKNILLIEQVEDLRKFFTKR